MEWQRHSLNSSASYLIPLQNLVDEEMVGRVTATFRNKGFDYGEQFLSIRRGRIFECLDRRVIIAPIEGDVVKVFGIIARLALLVDTISPLAEPLRTLIGASEQLKNSGAGPEDLATILCGILLILESPRWSPKRALMSGAAPPGHYMDGHG